MGFMRGHFTGSDDPPSETELDTVPSPEKPDYRTESEWVEERNQIQSDEDLNREWKIRSAQMRPGTGTEDRTLMDDQLSEENWREAPRAHARADGGIDDSMQGTSSTPMPSSAQSADTVRRNDEPADDSDLPCPHTTLVPHWETISDMGNPDRVQYYICDACKQTFSGEEGRWLKETEAERLAELHIAERERGQGFEDTP